MSLEHDHEKVRKSKPLSFSVFFFALECERILIRTHSNESRCDIEPENRLFAGCPCTFSPESLQAEAVKGLSLFDFFFTLACERIFIKMHSIEGRCVTGPEYIH